MVAVEEPLAVYVKDEPFVTLLSSPTMKKELAIGHLLGTFMIGILSLSIVFRVRG